MKRIPLYKLTAIRGASLPPELAACLGKTRDEVDLYLQSHGFSPIKTLMAYRGRYHWVFSHYAYA